ncbi:contractile injection system protein, VgrG/Pvc8 family [Sulfuricurvum sp.]|uniref:phage late control D family protein n=1 Tax=Sulfuricurvum sp. TaxID=2025608 RepID=UPI002635BAC2|nr:contractile injection system protein, VgrG/Pvc8 family [Sulfuricurvum sp.]MDD2267004.1 contractile injection system protein, VgrG/Pvc8 family [Sulfuricurvum sp.]MDD2782620.1 contractile injection system protein, VgrG/Pvc8 family [Sulfuricurvum sp.]
MTESLRTSLVSIEYSDDIDDTADGFTIKFQGESFTPPSFKDILKVWIGYRDNIWYIGSFSVLKSRLEYETMEVSVTATPIDFGNDIKEKITTSYDNVTLDQILQKIAARNGLNIKNSFPKHTYSYKSQTHESDIAFMRRLAGELGATFAIKNNTILFRPKKWSDQEDELPDAVIDAKSTKGLWFETLDKTFYKSVTAMWHSTKENHNKRVTVGSGKPALHIEGVFKDESDARTKAKAKLEAANRGMARGGFDYEGVNIIAGSLLNLSNIPPGWPSKFSVQQVRHVWGESGYTVSVEFEN